MSRKTYFNEAAQDWNKKFYTSKLATFLQNFVSKIDLKPGQTILDVGTGTGILIPFLLEAIGPTGSITAIDYAEKMVQRSQSKYGNIRNVTIELQDVEELNLPSESFDMIICFGLFPHLENRVQALNQMNRVLKPGGRLLIAHALSSAEIKAHHTISTVVTHDALPKKDEIRRLLKHAGFSEIVIEDKPGRYLCFSTKH